MEVHVVMRNYTERKKICMLPCEILVIVFYFKPLFIKMRLARIQEHPDSLALHKCTPQNNRSPALILIGPPEAGCTQDL